MDALERSRRASAHPSTTTITIADYAKLVALLDEAFDGTAPARPHAADLLQRVRRPDRRSRTAKLGALHRNRDSPPSTDASSAATQAAYYRQALAARRTASRPCAACSSSTPSTSRPRRLAVGPLLRGRHAEAEPARRSAATVADLRDGQARDLRSLGFRAWPASTSRTRFFRVDPAWRRLPIDERARGQGRLRRGRRGLGRAGWPRCAPTRSPACGRTRDFFLWKITERYEDLGELGAALNATPLAGWLETPYSYLATTKASEYTKARKPRQVVPKGSPYLVVYPFVKVRPWYALPAGGPAARDGRAHARSAHEFPTILNHTTYSFGIDDQEFMTAFECDEPADFMHLMLTLRDSEASRYTERDTPIFVGRSTRRRSATGASTQLDGAVGAAARRRPATPQSVRGRRSPSRAVRVLVAPDAPHGEAGEHEDRERRRSGPSRSRPRRRSATATFDDDQQRRAVEDARARGSTTSRSRPAARARRGRRRTRSRGRTRSARAGTAPSASTRAGARRSPRRSAR